MLKAIYYALSFLNLYSMSGYLEEREHRLAPKIAESTRELIGKIVIVKQPEAASVGPGDFVDALSDTGLATAVGLIGKFRREKVSSAETCDTQRGREALKTLLAGHEVEIKTAKVLAPSPQGEKLPTKKYEERMLERIYDLLIYLNEGISLMVKTRLAMEQEFVPNTKVLISHSLLLQRALEAMLKPHSTIAPAADVVGFFKPGHTYTLHVEYDPETKAPELSLEYEGKTYEVKPVPRSLLLGLPLPEEE